MGGTICVAVRTSDHREYVWHRWTNAVGWHFTNPLFRAEDPKAIGEFIETGDESAYGGRVQEIDSIEYGTIGIDFATKTALSANGYSRLGRYSSWDRDFTRGDCERELSLIEADERPMKFVQEFPGEALLSDDEWEAVKKTLKTNEMLIWRVIEPFTLVTTMDTPFSDEKWDECKKFFKDWKTPVAVKAETVRYQEEGW